MKIVMLSAIAGLLAIVSIGCENAPSKVSGNSDSDSDTDTDTDTDTDIDTDNFELTSYIWIANTKESTLSKVNTKTEKEKARYKTCGMDHCDPSRTSVNLHGDMVVTNRKPINDSISMSSTVVKFAGDIKDCKGSNTSNGPKDVKNWNTDDCMLWTTELPDMPTGNYNQELDGHGARATAWDGLEDDKTGLGGNVWIGTCPIPAMSKNGVVYKLDGDTGDILGSIPIKGCAYGGVMDGKGSFWLIDWLSDFKTAKLTKIDMKSMKVASVYDVQCGYGISADSKGRIWTGGGSRRCISRFDPVLEETKELFFEDTFPRGIAVGANRSAGYVWAVNTNGTLNKINEDTVELESVFPVNVDLNEEGYQLMIGVAIDHEGYVWTVSEADDAAYKIDPSTLDIVKVPIGLGPYTYSDMTGVQLKNVVIIE